ncbi:MAG TPA: enoyl-ACP reductase FabV [Thermoanaerobaculia bacterium]|jgi:enoyl-[acyl-carrier protein] reductase/trans-2-enoyl-CoA reductase (NAD+)|nr:enoyl-ACP reductase FabV [Thermoanaerobaculia bacterium]
MIIKPKVRGFICTTAHPVGAAREVQRQADYARGLKLANGKPRAALVVGSSMGYGLSTRIAAAFGGGAGTVGVFLEKPASDKRTATAGWYNSAAFHRAAADAGLYASSIDGDAFSAEIKQQAVDTIRRDLGQVDLVVYSLAAPRRTLADGSVAKSVLKPIGQTYRNKTIDVESGAVSEVSIEPAEEAEITDTVKVMGGEDWEAWIDALEQGGVLAPDAKTLAYSYIGPELTYAVYRKGTIGRAKDHLEATAHRLDERLRKTGGRAFISVNKGLVTQSSSAIPVVPLYISLLFRVMKDKGLHEGTIEQMGRLMTDRLYAGGDVPTDDEGRIRLDDWEMRDDVQAKVERRWHEVTSDNVEQLSDLAGYRHDFLQLFGFEVPGVDYDADVDPHVALAPEA